ncbi:hypothetical protein DESC_290174 [Desulfosarcina cetonica]|nr:hypothetical protein DESC_290174 [Desulfosarcina cetonica]
MSGAAIAGPATWPKESDNKKLQAMVEEIGAPLMDIAVWAGSKAGEQDRESLNLLVYHLLEILKVCDQVCPASKKLVIQLIN